MKTFLPLFSLILALPCHGELASKAPTRDAVTPEELAARVKKIRADAAAAEKEKPSPPFVAPDPAVVAAEEKSHSLSAMSEFLSLGGRFTLVPKGAIIHVPSAYASHVGIEAGAKYQDWPEFYAANRGSITTQEVSRAQAEGRDPIPEDIQKAFSKSPYIVVATYLTGPITVLKPSKPGVDSNRTKPQ